MWITTFLHKNVIVFQQAMDYSVLGVMIKVVDYLPLVNVTLNMFL
jgi:hypothetical protein